MRKLTLGLAIGLVIGILGTVLVQRLWRTRLDPEALRTGRLFQSVPLVVEQALPGSKVLDVMPRTPSTQEVNYENEALYDVVVTYQSNGQVKRFVVPFGFAKGMLITPSVSDLVIADDKAAVLHRLGSREDKPKEWQPNEGAAGDGQRRAAPERPGR